MIGAAIGAGLKIGGAIFGGISASKAMRKAKENVESQKQQNQNWYDQRYNEDATQRADAMRALTRLREDIRNRNRAASGKQSVIGGTEESVAATKAANAKAMADTTSNIAAEGERRKDAIESQYLQRESDLNQQLQQIEVNRANETTKAITGAAQIGADIAGAFDFNPPTNGNKEQPIEK